MEHKQRGIVNDCMYQFHAAYHTTFTVATVRSAALRFIPKIKQTKMTHT